MKSYLHHFLVLTIFCSFLSLQKSSAQNTLQAYNLKWKLVKEHLDKGLPKSALTEVKTIYQKAKKERNEGQLIKSVIYIAGLQPETAGMGHLLSIQEIEKELKVSKEPVKSILNSVLAGLHLSSYNRVRWKLYNRTQTTGYKKDDIETWGTADFHEKIRELYLLSLKNENQLQQIKLDYFNDILVKGNTTKLRPTLYDLLTHEALKYFSSDERDVQKPADSFEISGVDAFAPAADFMNLKFESKDSTSLQLYALTLYQKLIAFHLNDKSPEALIDVDLLRLQYAKQKSIHPDKDQLYLTAIRQISNKYHNVPASAQALYLIASDYFEKAGQYQAGQDTLHRFEAVKAAALCKQIITTYPDSEGGVNAQNLLTRIREQSLQFSTENVNLPDRPFRVFVTYKNITKLHLRLVRATESIKSSLRNGMPEDKWNTLSNTPAVRNWEQSLPDQEDYQLHHVEIKVDSLPFGEYVLLAGTDPAFKNKQAILGARLLAVSDISYIHDGESYFVLNRDTGKPLPAANVAFWTSRYNSKVLSYEKQKKDSYITDSNGYFARDKDSTANRQYNESIEITYGKDKFSAPDQNYTYYNKKKDGEDKEPIENIFLFTDRSLYRPGQIVYYKGIARKGDGVLKDRSKEIVVKLNSNGKEIEKTTKKVNEYGSFSGQFTLPVGQLNGMFTINADERNQVYFYVEEYKRPGFSVSYDTLKSVYQLNDTIVISGNAIAYAGNTVDGAKVSYRVVRNSRFPYLWKFARGWFPQTASQEITNGTTITDNNGKFLIAFKAMPDPAIDKKLDPVFNYTIYADVTDRNGETRTAETLFSAGYKSILLKNSIPLKLSADSLKNLAITTENMNGRFQPAEIKINIIKQIPENRLIRSRLWEAPDVFVMSKNDYVSNFPNDEYDKESRQENWPEAGIIFSKTGNLAVSQKFDISEKKFAPGFYKIQISTKDKSGEEIKDIKYVELTNQKSDQPGYPQYLYTERSNRIEPGEKTAVRIGSSADNVFVINTLSKNSQQKKSFNFISLNNQILTFDFTATEKDRGGYGVNYVFIKNNRLYQFQEVISVPWTNKELNIEYLTFRDKTQPGGQEKWKVKISGYKKEKIVAEMLGSMYDASLDQFYDHQWNMPDLWPHPKVKWWNSSVNFQSGSAMTRYSTSVNYKSFEKSYDQLMQFDFNNRIMIRGKMAQQMRGIAGSAAGMVLNEEKVIGEVKFFSPETQIKKDSDALKTDEPESNIEQVSVRKNFNETAFWLPEVQTNKQGEIEFSFTMPEALTRWKFQALAHTKELAFGYSSKEIVTQKDLMVQPNPPRFLREGDQIDFSSKVVNLTDQTLNGTVSLQLFDTETNKTVDDLFQNTTREQKFIVNAKGSKAVAFKLQVPHHFTKTLTWRIVARAGSFSDGEENILPVLSNRALVTESMPLPMSGNGSKDFRFEKLINSGNSKTLTNESLTVEYTSNPAWYAVQALPTLMEFKNECAEQTWNAYYANSLAAHVANSSPKLRQVFETWKTLDTAALQSNLEKNQELKSVLLEEMPWLLEAKSETEQKRNIGLLFDIMRMSRELDANFDKLKQMQNTDGGFVWFKGGSSDRYMTQYIVTGIGHLKKINAIQKGQEEKINNLIRHAIGFPDLKMKEEYDLLIKNKVNLKLHQPSSLIIQYLYMRSFFPEVEIPSGFQKAHDYFLKRIKENWISQTKYMQGMIALTLHRSKDKVTSNNILKSLTETATLNEETGMTWPTSRGWWWYEAPIERQALLIEAFDEIGNDTKTVNALRTWLLKNKQTNRWESTKATAEACYAMLFKGTEWLSGESAVHINLGDLTINSTEEKQEAGTGYLKKKIAADKISASMGNIEVDVMTKSTSNRPTWGAVYWQYFEDLDKITFAETPLKIEKKLFIEKNSDTGPVLSPVNEGTSLHVGDKIKVRIELRVDRDMEYVHMKDMRASALEPVNVLSGYKWQGGLGYYESTKDAGTNFFFSSLRKGTYVFEYPLFVTHEGDFSNGITTVQCMYAPEFTAHSEGVRIRVK